MSFTNEDRISHLPDEILSHILSSIPTKFGVRTSILSKNWRYKWTLVTNLDFIDHHPVEAFNSLSTFVNRAFKLCKTSKIKRFRLFLTRYGLRATSEVASKMSNWISEAVRLNVSEVMLHVSPFELPISLFTCKTLRKLSLDGWGMEDFIGPNVDFILPLLTDLHITCPITLPGKVSVNAFRLIHSCPMLENLSLNVPTCYEEEDYNFNIPTLRRLKLSIIGRKSINSVTLNLPNLELLCIVGVLSSFFVIEDVSSLVDATVAFFDVHEFFFFLYTGLVKAISSAKYISWSSPTLDVLLKSTLPEFPNLEKLELEGSLQSQSVLLFQHLKTCSKLEHLCFQEPEESCWDKRKSVPTWMLPNLKTMEITKCKGRKCDMQFIKYVLGNLEGLKKLTVRCESLSMEDEKELCGRLSTFSRASRGCEIHFVGKWLLNMFYDSTVFYFP